MRFFRVFAQEDGFSIIELTIVFSLLAVVTGIGLFSFLDFSHLQEVDQGAKDVASFMERARSNATSFVKPEGDCGTDPLRGYSVTYCPNSSECESTSQYEMRVLCGDEDYLVDTMDLTDQVTHDPASDCLTVVYRVLNGVVEGDLPCSQVLVRSGKSEIVTVNSQGDVVFGEDGQGSAE